jgi:integrase
MASISKRDNVWRVQVYVKGQRDSGTFTTKAQAQAWAAQRETELRQQSSSGIVVGKTIQNAFERYEKEVSRIKRGHRWEALRLDALVDMKIELDGAGSKQLVRFGDIKLSDLTAKHVAALRDMRLKSVASSTVNRDMNLISHVFSVARREWHWIAESPTKDVRRPKDPAPRDRRPTDDETERLCFALGFDESPATTASQRVATAYLFAIETAMRAGEICKLMPAYINGRVASLPGDVTKNGMKRDVALSTRALELLKLLPAPKEGEPLFGLTAGSLDALFRKAKTKCAIEDLTFHDTRHEAITRLAKKLNVLELARMVGHRDLRMLQVYYNESAAEIAARLD